MKKGELSQKLFYATIGAFVYMGIGASALVAIPDYIWRIPFIPFLRTYTVKKWMPESYWSMWLREFKVIKEKFLKN